MKSLLLRFRSFCVSCFPFVAFCLVVSNFIVSCSVLRTSRPQYRYTTVVVTNESFSVISNLNTISSLAGVPVSTQSIDSASSPPPPPVYQNRYKYFVLESRRMASMDGTYYQEGDVCSRGIILRIFPDRIILHNGTTIENLQDSQSPIRKKDYKK